MVLVAKSEEAITRSLGMLRWYNRMAAAVVGAFAAFFFGMLVTLSVMVLSYIAIAGAVGGLLWERWLWKRAVERLASSFLKLDGEFLEVRGVVHGTMGHFRFRIKDLAKFEVGQRKASPLGAMPAIRALESTALIVGEASGGTIALHLASVIFDQGQLVRFGEHLAAQSAK
jgi:hypothetical protein